MAGAVPRIDVALATYNGAAHLGALLRSLAQQTHGNIEVILSDDGSTDATLSVAAMFDPVLDIRHVGDDKHYGLVRNFETALGGGTAAYLALCDQDDVWHPQKLHKLLVRMHELEAEHGPATPLAVFCDLRIVDAGLSVLSPSFFRSTLKSPAASRFEHFLLGNHVPGCALLINRRLLDLALPFPEVPVHDWWLLQVAGLLGRIGFVDAVLVDYRQHGGNAVGIGGNNSGSQPDPAAFMAARRLRWGQQALAIRANLNALQARFGTRLPAEQATVIERILRVGGAGNTVFLRRSGERWFDRVGIGMALGSMAQPNGYRQAQK